MELGTCIGISAAYQAAAIKLNEKGKLITLEGSVERTKIANENFMNLQSLIATVENASRKNRCKSHLLRWG